MCFRLFQMILTLKMSISLARLSCKGGVFWMILTLKMSISLAFYNLAE